MRLSTVMLALVGVVVLSSGCAGGGDDPAAGAPAAAGQPGHGLIVFKRFDPKIAKVRLYTIRPDGSGLRPLTRPGPNADNDSDADFSPDGRRIAFGRVFQSGAPDAVMVVNRDGSGLRDLTRTACTGDCLGYAQPAWSPNGRRIAVMGAIGPLPSDGPPAVVGIFVMDANGSNVRQLTQLQPNSGTEDHSPTWSPDGRRIAFMRANNTAAPENASAIYTVKADGSDLRLVRRMPRKWPGAGAPDWSPDGKRLLFSTFCWFGPCGQAPTGAQLFTIKPNGDGLRKLTHLRGNSYNAGWSPDGRKIVFAHHRALGPEGDIYTINADGSGVRRLTHKPKLDSHRPDWGRASR
jgi:Tol biopolymer transport system component